MPRIQTEHSQTLVEVLKKTLGDDSVRIGVELGVNRGWTSEVLLKAFPDLRLYMVDRWVSWRKETEGEITEESENIEEEAWRRTSFAKNRRVPLRMDTTEAADLFNVEALDFVYVDAGHLYEEVKADLLNYVPRVRKGGVVVGHDYKGRYSNRFGGGVERAVDEFAKVNGYRLHVEEHSVWWFRK